MSKTDKDAPYRVKIARASLLREEHSGCEHALRPGSYQRTYETIEVPAGYQTKTLYQLVCCGSKLVTFDEAVFHVKDEHESRGSLEQWATARICESYPQQPRKQVSQRPIAERVADLPHFEVDVWVPAHEETVKHDDFAVRECDLEDGSEPIYGWSHRKCSLELVDAREVFGDKCKCSEHSKANRQQMLHRPARRTTRQQLKMAAHEHETYGETDIDTELKYVHPKRLPQGGYC